MSGYLWRVLVHKLREGRGLFLLTVLGVALGVASVLSIQVLNQSSVGAFHGAMKAISGAADLSILPGARAMDEGLFVVARATPGVAAAWPLVDVDVALDDAEDLFLDLIGVDVYAHTGIPWTAGDTRSLSQAQRTAGWVAVSPELAAARGWTVGSRFGVSSGTRRIALEVGALVDFRKLAPTAGTRLAVMDIGQAQVQLGMAHELSQIDVRLAPGADLAAVKARLQDRLGPGVEVLTPASRARRTDGLLEAFRLNLTALSLISLVVGFFLVFSATRASLVRRRRELGLLRSLGATRAQVLGLLLAEVALLGLLGVLLGVPLGLAAAEANLGVVTKSLSNLYLIQETEALTLPGWLVPLGVAMGLLGALAGGVGPATEMATREPTELLAAYTLHERARSRAVPLALGALGVLATAGVWFRAWAGTWQPAGFVLAVELCAAIPLLAPLLIETLTGGLRPDGFGLAYAARSLGSELATTSYAVSALGIAVSMMLGVTIMVESFRGTVGVWVEGTVQADVYLTSRSWHRAGVDAGLDPALVESLRRLPGVRGMDRLRRDFSLLEGRPVVVNAIDLALESGRGASRNPIMRGPPDAGRQAVRPGTCLISEPLMRHFGVDVGDTLELPGPAGPVPLEVLAVYHDYTTDLGEVTVHLGTMPSLAGPGPIQSLSLYLEPGLDPERMVDRIKATYPDLPLWVRSNRTLRQEVFAIFDQTFAITRVLQLMALLVASCTIALTLLVLARERTRELALVAALGATPRQVLVVFLGKGLAIAGLGLVLGGAGGVGLAAILIHVINPAYFGWTLRAHLPVAAVAGQVMTIVLATMLASLYPAWRAARTPATELTREDL